MKHIHTLAREIAPSALALLLLLGSGAALAWAAHRAVAIENRSLATAQGELRRIEQRLALTAQEERDARDHIELYELRSSALKVELALLHEGDLLGFLSDLRASGNAYYSVRQCSVGRTADAVPAARVAPRLRATCQIDLITLAEAKGSR